MKLRKIKNCWWETFNTVLKNIGSSTSTSDTSDDVFPFVFILPFVSFGVRTVFLWWNKKSSFKQQVSTRVNKKKIRSSWKDGKHALNFDQWKTFHENYKPIRVCLWLLYKTTEKCCGLWFLRILFKPKSGILPLSTK